MHWRRRGLGLLFRGRKLTRVVSSRPGAAAQRVDAITGELVRHRVEPELLGRTERAAFGLSDDLQRRFFTHAGTPAPVGIEAR